MSDTVAVRLVVRGRVQGVGFRDAVVDAARRAGVAGWVRNTRDGAVEAFVQGGEAEVERVASWCGRGPPAARVESVERHPAMTDATLQRFERRPTA